MFAACSSEKPAVPEGARETAGQKLKALSWLAGSWQGLSAEIIVCEHWERQNDSLYTGAGYFISGKDTLSQETLRLEEREGKVLYIPSVKEQNEGKPVSFTLTSAGDKEFIFENAAHDYPQKIRYTKLSEDSLLAEISGITEGKEQTQRFPMQRKR